MSHKLSRFLIGRGACGYCMHRSLEFNDKDAVFSYCVQQYSNPQLVHVYHSQILLNAIIIIYIYIDNINSK